MVEHVLRPSRRGNFVAGVAVVGRAPAKVTSVALRTANKGVVKFVIGLPNDAIFASYAIYALDSTSLTDPGFPGGSPILRDIATKTEDDTAKPGVRRHYWIVTQDQNGVPDVPVAGNAYWAGSIIPSLSSTFIVS